MTSEAQRTAIAEACGLPKHQWSKPISDEQIGFVPTCRRCGLYGEIITSSFCDAIPDYLTDLNEMHEAEKTLSGEWELTYVRELTQVVMRGFTHHKTFEFSLAHATAAQRAEAFLRAKGLLKD